MSLGAARCVNGKGRNITRLLLETRLKCLQLQPRFASCCSHQLTDIRLRLTTNPAAPCYFRKAPVENLLRRH